MGLFGRKKPAGSVFSREALSHYESRDVVSDVAVVDLIVVGMVKLDAMRTPRRITKDILDASGEALERMDEARIWSVYKDAGRLSGWEQGKTLTALLELRKVRARSDFPELAKFQLASEMRIQTHTQMVEGLSREFLAQVSGASDREVKQIMKQGESIAAEVDYAVVLAQRTVEAVELVQPQLVQHFVDAMKAPRTIRDNALIRQEMQEAERLISDLGLSVR